MCRPIHKPLLATMIALLALGGCGKAPEPPPDAGAAHIHHNRAPHGGTVVALGDDQFNVELVVDAADGKIQAYVLDDELENFVRSPSRSIEMTASVAGQPKTIVLAAVANPATGETIGDTALFEGEADWLKATPTFEGVLKSLSVRASTFTDVKFQFPKGSEAQP